MKENKECEYCHNSEPFRDCCYYDDGLQRWVEQKLISDYDKTNNIEDLFSNEYVDVHIVESCPVCGRKLGV